MSLQFKIIHIMFIHYKFPPHYLYINELEKSLQSIYVIIIKVYKSFNRPKLTYSQTKQSLTWTPYRKSSYISNIIYICTYKRVIYNQIKIKLLYFITSSSKIYPIVFLEQKKTTVYYNNTLTHIFSLNTLTITTQILSVITYNLHKLQNTLYLY